MVFFGELYFEIRVINDVVYLLEVLVVVGVLALEDEFEELEVEDCFVGVGIVGEHLDLPVIVHQVVLEERGVGVSLHEEFPL